MTTSTGASATSGVSASPPRRTPPKRKARQLAKYLREERPDYAYLKAVFRALRDELDIEVQREPKTLPFVPSQTLRSLIVDSAGSSHETAGPDSIFARRPVAESSKSRFSAPSPHIISKSPLTQYKRPPESSPPKFFRYLSRRQFTPYCASSDLTSGRFRMC